MTDVQFWEIIALFDWGKSGDDKAVIESAVEQLSQHSVQDILKFADILSEKLYSLDTEEHAREIGEFAYADEDDYLSSEWFLFARCCVVANGAGFYQNVLSYPEDFPKDLEFEYLLTVPRVAYERKTGEDYDYTPLKNVETNSNLDGWA